MVPHCVFVGYILVLALWQAYLPHFRFRNHLAKREQISFVANVEKMFSSHGSLLIIAIYHGEHY